MSKRRLFIFIALSGVLYADPILFSQFPSSSVPESISIVPAGFGTFAGQYFVTDATTNTAVDSPGIIRQVPSSGGAPTTFANTPLNPRNGIFLPAGFGLFGGDYAVANYPGNAVVGIDPGNSNGAITVYNAAGAQSTFYTANNFIPTSLAIAPPSFGVYAGDLLVGYTGTVAGIAAFDSAGNRSEVLARSLPFDPIDTAFAPAGFGSDGGLLFITSDRSPVIDTVAANGTVNTFVNLPYPPTQALKFVGFAPAGFGAWAGDLIVGVPGSGFGAPNGDLLVIDSQGHIVAQLTGLNPRGFTFIDGGTEMLLNNTVTPGVLQVSPNDFSATVPEPGTFAICGLALGLCAARVRRRK